MTLLSGIADIVGIAALLQLLVELRHALERTTVWPRLIIPSFVLAGSFAASSGFSQVAVALFALIEIIILPYLILQSTAAMRKEPTSPETLIAAKLAPFVPVPVAIFLAKEIVVVVAAARLILRYRLSRTLTAGERFGYSDSMTLQIALFLPIFAIPELFLLHVLFFGHAMLLTALDAIEAYTILWVYGIVRLAVERPHIVHADEAWLNCSVLKSVRVPIGNIESAAVENCKNESDRRKLRRTGYNMTIPDVPVVSIDLCRPIMVRTALTASEKSIRRLYVSAERPSELCAALSNGTKRQPYGGKSQMLG